MTTITATTATRRPRRRITPHGQLAPHSQKFFISTIFKVGKIYSVYPCLIYFDAGDIHHIRETRLALLGRAGLARNQRVRYGAYTERLAAAARSIHIERRRLHLNSQHAHLLPLFPAVGIIAVEEVACQNVANLVAHTQLLGLLDGGTHQPEIRNRGERTRQAVLRGVVRVGA